METTRDDRTSSDRLVQAIEDLVRPILAAVGVELDRVELKPAPGGQRLSVFIDGPGGVTVDDCAEVSRQLSALMDEDESLLRGRHVLEVSSPGLTRPLRGEADFRRFVGRLARLQAKVPVVGRRREVVGRLQGVEGGQVVLEEQQSREAVRVPLEAVAKAHLEVE